MICNARWPCGRNHNHPLLCDYLPTSSVNHAIANLHLEFKLHQSLGRVILGPYFVQLIIYHKLMAIGGLWF
jgi:hypothetical protein